MLPPSPELPAAVPVKTLRELVNDQPDALACTCCLTRCLAGLANTARWVADSTVTRAQAGSRWAAARSLWPR